MYSAVLDFEIGDKVRIGGMEINGRIVSIWHNKRGTTYEVRYFDGCDVKTAYFYPDELTEIENGSQG